VARPAAGRGRRRRLGFGLATLLGLRRLGFFIPYRWAAGVEARDYPALEPVFARALPACREVLDAIEGFAAELARIDGPAPEPRWDQAWFPRLDAAAAYALVRTTRPRRIVEVGSGHSTRFLARAVSDGRLATAITCIDPAPRAALGRLPLHHVRSTLQEAPAAFTAGLEAGDMLVVDSSHILMPGTDVDLLLTGVLPRLAKGVLIHVHDVFLPDAYPEAWAWRGYNEQSAIAALLLGDGFRLRFASHYLVTRRPTWVERGVLARLPISRPSLESSLWLEKRCPPVA
jgi:predicted O-methyltransferase YrrM